MRATNDFTVPDNLLGLAGADERSRFDASASLPGSAVTYTLRFYTGDKMGSGLTTPDAGVQVMLISADGRAFMQRVDRYPDVGEADANLALYSSPRFNRGDVDEVSFASPDLGCPAAIWIAPEAGGEWFLEEVELSCSEGSSMALAAAADGTTPGSPPRIPRRATGATGLLPRAASASATSAPRRSSSARARSSR